VIVDVMIDGKKLETCRLKEELHPRVEFGGMNDIYSTII
jgi:hypothetical protein